MERGSPSKLLAIEGLTKTYGNGVLALTGVDLALETGEVLVLVGASGCGKSTLLRLIAGLANPSDGRLTWTRQAPKIGFVFQDPTLMPWATVAQNVALPLVLRDRPRAEISDRVDEMLELVDLSDARDRHPRALSGGMRMRASLARALIDRPDLLLLDEPFAAIDEITRFRLDDMVLNLKRRFGVTVLFVTHSVYEAAYLADRVAVMSPRPGRIVSIVASELPADRGPAAREGQAFATMARTISRALGAAGTSAQ